MTATGSLSRLNYTDNEDMQWIVGANMDENATLVFTDFKTEMCCDYVMVYSCLDTSCLSVVTLAELRGTLDLPFLLTSTTGVLKIVWHSDYSIAYSGWSATWTTSSRKLPLPVGTNHAVSLYLIHNISCRALGCCCKKPRA